MHCAVCQKPGGVDRPLNCELCAQSLIYKARIALVESLLKNESLEQQVEKQTAVQEPQKSLSLGQQAWALERSKAEQNISTSKTEKILPHNQALREQIQYTRLYIAKRKAFLARRRKDLASAQAELSHSRNTSESTVKITNQTTYRRWEAHQEQAGSLRLTHCAKTARLFSLQQEKRKKGSGDRDAYSIGFTQIPDLKELNNADPKKLTTALLHLANLVLLIAHHLSLQLPAQILLPTSSHPYPAILSPHVSYTSTPPLMPGASSHTKTPASQHLDSGTVPRARPLFLQKQISVIAKDDTRTYSYHIEGITLLAWNIAWLCRTQGVNIGTGRWQDVCAMGRNLWLLTLGSSTTLPPTPNRVPTSTALRSDASTHNDATPSTGGDKQSNDAPEPGYYSHGTVYGYLGSPHGAEYMYRWKLADFIRVIHRVQNMLDAERAGTEWEILKEDEWAGEDEGEREGDELVVSGKNATGGKAGQSQIGRERKGAATVTLEQTGVLVNNMRDDVTLGQREDGKGKGASGWTKLRGR